MCPAVGARVSLRRAATFARVRVSDPSRTAAADRYRGSGEAGEAGGGHLKSEADRIEMLLE